MKGEILIVGLEKVDKERLDSLPNLKVIGTNTTGLDHIDLEECDERGIKVISLQGEIEFLNNITSTTEHTIGLIISLLRNYKIAFQQPYQDRDFYKGHTLKGKVLGIIRLGRIGLQVMEIAKVLKMKVVSGSVKSVAPLADVVSLHIPLQGNEEFFTKEMFKLMKPTSYLINTSRDKIIKRGALLWALKKSIIAGAAVDFVDDEKLVEYSKIHNNLILTNHIGGCTFEDMEKTSEFIRKKVAEYIKLNEDKRNTKVRQS